MSSHTDTRQPDARRRVRLAAALLGATCLAAAGVAYGQAGLPYDPSQLPETKGAVKQYTLTPRGDVDGLILTDGTEVKVPPHLTAQVVFAVRPGDAVTIRGLKARALPLISAATIRNDASGATVTDEGGPRERDRDRAESLVTAKVASLLHGPRGEVNGVLLENGTVLRMPPPEAARWEKLIQPGQTLSARGVVTATLLGSVMEARAIGATPDQLTYLALPKPPKHEREAREERGPGPREAREDRGPKGPREARDERGPRGPRDDREPSRTAASDVFAPPPPPPPPGGPGAAPPPPPPGGPGAAPPPPAVPARP